MLTNSQMKDIINNGGSVAYNGKNITTIADLPSDADITAYQTSVANAISGLEHLKGSLDCSANPNYPAADVGDRYIVSVAGKIGGSSGDTVDVGDIIECKTNNSAAG